jgi:hypothetical protein
MTPREQLIASGAIKPASGTDQPGGPRVERERPGVACLRLDGAAQREAARVMRTAPRNVEPRMTYEAPPGEP